MRQNNGDGPFGRIFGSLIRVMSAPGGHSRPIALDRRQARRSRRLKRGEDVGRSFISIEGWIVHDLLRASD